MILSISLSQLSRPMPCRHYISWKHRLWRASCEAEDHPYDLACCSMATSAAQSRTGRRDRAAKGCLGGANPDRAAGSGSQGGQDGAREVGRNEAATHTRSYTHCGLETMSANKNGKRNIL